jgi:hypothetical protein
MTTEQVCTLSIKSFAKEININYNIKLKKITIRKWEGRVSHSVSCTDTQLSVYMNVASEVYTPCTLVMWYMIALLTFGHHSQCTKSLIWGNPFFIIIIIVMIQDLV